MVSRKRRPFRPTSAGGTANEHGRALCRPVVQLDPARGRQKSFRRAKLRPKVRIAAPRPLQGKGGRNCSLSPRRQGVHGASQAGAMASLDQQVFQRDPKEIGRPKGGVTAGGSCGGVKAGRCLGEVRVEVAGLGDAAYRSTGFFRE